MQTLRHDGSNLPARTSSITTHTETMAFLLSTRWVMESVWSKSCCKHCPLESESTVDEQPFRDQISVQARYFVVVSSGDMFSGH
jgi:hypothetical protein